MARYKNYDYSQKVFVPVSLEDQLEAGTLEFAIHTLVETRMDLSVFDNKYCNDETGRLASDPKVLLKVVLLGYSRGLISSRKIERACRENIMFMALSCGQYPDHSTIAAFVSSMKDEIAGLFRDVLLVCEQMDLLGGTFFALDGCRLPSNASREWSGKVGDFKKRKEKLEGKVEELLSQQITADRGDSEDDIGPRGTNRDKQIAKLQKQAERIERWLKENKAKTGKTGKEIQSNITDNESANMITSKGRVQGYNAQALVDNKCQVIIHADAFGVSQDFGTLAPMLDGAKENVESIAGGTDYFKGKIFTADANYHCQKNIKKCQEDGLDAHIPDRNFPKRDPRFKTKRRRRGQAKRFTLEDFQYQKATDTYICPRGKPLALRVKRMVVDSVIYRQHVAKVTDCKNCTLKSKCLNATGAKKRYLSVPTGALDSNLTKKMAKKIDSERGRKIYHQRMAIAEPVFANIRTQKRLDRFTFRAKIKVSIQWMLYCIVHNMEKIANYGFA
jgi:transposase/IS5 family transposase